MINNNKKIYGLFYKSHGAWTPYNNKMMTLDDARETKKYVHKLYKSSTIIRRVKFV